VTVSNGQGVNQTVTNAAFMSRTASTTDTTAIVALNNAVAASGASVAQIQRFLNALASSLGLATSDVFDFKFTYSSDVIGALNDTMLVRVGALTEEFIAATGHTHDGTNGEGAIVSALASTGTKASPSNIVAGTGIVLSTTVRQGHIVQGSGAAVTISANPAITNGTNVFQELELMGASDTNTLTLNDGNGLFLNGQITLRDNSMLTLRWNGVVWVEKSRSE